MVSRFFAFQPSLIVRLRFLTCWCFYLVSHIGKFSQHLWWECHKRKCYLPLVCRQLFVNLICPFCIGKHLANLGIARKCYLASGMPGGYCLLDYTTAVPVHLTDAVLCIVCLVSVRAINFALRHKHLNECKIRAQICPLELVIKRRP